MNNNSTNKLAFLNPLKFVGALMIAIYLHYDEHLLSKLKLTNPLADSSLLMMFMQKSFIFVEMFFVISGLLFVLAYKDKLAGSLKLGAFIKKRYLRIFPLAIATSIYMYIFNLILYSRTGSLWVCGTTSIWELLSNILYGGNSIFAGAKTLNGPIWYVQMLMICYIIAALISKNIQKSRFNFVYTLPIVLGIIMRATNLSLPFWCEDFSRALIAFFAGIILGLVIKRYDALTLARKNIVRGLLIIEILLILYIIARHSEWLSPITTYVALLLFPEVILLMYDVQWINKICQTRFFTTLGDISFDIYLLNFPIMITIHTLIVTGILHINVATLPFMAVFTLIHIILSLLIKALRVPHIPHP